MSDSGSPRERVEAVMKDVQPHELLSYEGLVLARKLMPHLLRLWEAAEFMQGWRSEDDVRDLLKALRALDEAAEKELPR